MKVEPTVELKVKEIMEELKNQALWKKRPPDWVASFSSCDINVAGDFLTWLQFVFLPNCLLTENRDLKRQESFVLKAKILFGSDQDKQKLLRLFIELDSLI